MKFTQTNQVYESFQSMMTETRELSLTIKDLMDQGTDGWCTLENIGSSDVRE